MIRRLGRRRVPAMMAAAFAILMLIPGWVFGFTPILHLGTTRALTMPSTALCILAVSLAIIAATKRSPGEKSVSNFARGAAIFATLFAGANILIRLFVQPQGIDQWLPISLQPDHAMAFGTSITIIVAALCSGALVPGLSPLAKTTIAIPVLSTLLGVIASKLGHLPEIILFREMSLPTAIMLTLLLVTIVLPEELPDPGNEDDDEGSLPV